MSKSCIKKILYNSNTYLSILPDGTNEVKFFGKVGNSSWIKYAEYTFVKDSASLRLIT